MCLGLTNLAQAPNINLEIIDSITKRIRNFGFGAQ